MPSCCGDVGGSAERHFGVQMAVRLCLIWHKRRLTATISAEISGDEARGDSYRYLGTSTLRTKFTVYTSHANCDFKTSCESRKILCHVVSAGSDPRSWPERSPCLHHQKAWVKTCRLKMDGCRWHGCEVVGRNTQETIRRTETSIHVHHWVLPDVSC
ncbi:hypothetical protein IQ06DRAFT_23053 [Phaeosphaeriaceae sp. SRC1lsM3a]|nr:hypothetical protein IQ06DRAFT_23053 [Stagonospora sp. SRC1lsM3a]